ncbi:hypothetical protein SEVIR_9G368850v4 [Setaria viridis]
MDPRVSRRKWNLEAIRRNAADDRAAIDQVAIDTKLQCDLALAVLHFSCCTVPSALSFFCGCNSCCIVPAFPHFSLSNCFFLFLMTVDGNFFTFFATIYFFLPRLHSLSTFQGGDDRHSELHVAQRRHGPVNEVVTMVLPERQSTGEVSAGGKRVRLEAEALRQSSDSDQALWERVQRVQGLFAGPDGCKRLRLFLETCFREVHDRERHTHVCNSEYR